MEKFFSSLTLFQQLNMDENNHSNSINYLKVTIPVSAHDTRVRKYLLKHYRTVVRSKENLHRAFARHEITVNGRPVEETRMLKQGDVVEVKYDKSIEEANTLKAVPIRICYEDDHLAVVWKPSGQVQRLQTDNSICQTLILCAMIEFCDI